MAKEQRLIDIEPVKKFIVDGLNSKEPNKAFGHDAIEILAEIEYAPTVDAVEVVRCKDCKHAHLTIGSEVKYCDMWSNGEELYLPPDFHCADGERRSENAAH